ncbi:hypothetical protein Rs2_44253 [Raphanus sativus]|nr:hypothetical protein Rs2_44253 [Raphanus sativus]
MSYSRPIVFVVLKAETSSSSSTLPSNDDAAVNRSSSVTISHMRFVRSSSSLPSKSSRYRYGCEAIQIRNGRVMFLHRWGVSAQILETRSVKLVASSWLSIYASPGFYGYSVLYS